MNEQGIMGMANLHAANGFGYGTPTEFHDLGDTEEACDAFGEYAGFVAEQLSPYTKYYTILNEYDFYARGKTGPWGDRYDVPEKEVWVTEMGWPARPYLTPSNYYNVEGAKKKSDYYSIWRNENAPENTYTVNTNKPYAEVLDLYGNIIQVVEGVTVAIKTKPEMQYVRGVDKPTKSTGVSITQGGNELEAMWYMESGSGISMRYTPDNEIKEGDKIMLIAGAYDADGMLLKVVVDNETYTGATMRLGFGISKEELSECKKLEFFIMEGDTIKPIVESIPIYGFKDDENITLSKRGDLYTVSGTSEMLKNKYVSITVLNDGARRANVDSDTYPDYCLYQGQTKADTDGYFEAQFTVDSDIVTGAAVNISADGFTTQKVIR